MAQDYLSSTTRLLRKYRKLHQKPSWTGGFFYGEHMIKQSIRLLLLLMPFIAIAFVDPQVGEGIRQITVKIGTTIDSIETQIDLLVQDSQATFTVLEAIADCCGEVSSKVDVLDTNISLI